MLRSIFVFLRSYPLHVLVWKIRCKLLRIKIPAIAEWQFYFENKKGIEIGGPSAIFDKNGYFTLYPCIASLDGVNFSNQTVWEGSLSENKPFYFGGRQGKQIICEGSQLKSIPDGSYDFLISCNNLEHIANPIATIFEWKRVLNNEGVMLLVLPNKVSNFDHRRPYTVIEHIINDFENIVQENDLTHVEEVLELHDLSRDPQAGTKEAFKIRCQKNFENRCLHHHVFSETLLLEMFLFCGMRVLIQHKSKTDIFILGAKIND